VSWKSTRKSGTRQLAYVRHIPRRERTPLAFYEPNDILDARAHAMVCVCLAYVHVCTCVCELQALCLSPGVSAQSSRFMSPATY
jgi:hypothetical protein